MFDSLHQRILCSRSTSHSDLGMHEVLWKCPLTPAVNSELAVDNYLYREDVFTTVGTVHWDNDIAVVWHTSDVDSSI